MTTKYFKNNFLLYGLLIIGLVISCEKEVIFENSDYTIGTIYEYVPGWANGPTSVRFEYNVNNKNLNTGYSNGDNKWQIPGNAGYKSGDMFMVEYDINNVDLAKMLFDYPVKDSSDYIRYYEKLRKR